MVGLLNVSDYGKTLDSQNRIATLQRQMDDLQNQVSTGKKATNFGGYGVDAAVSLSFQAQSDRLDSYNTAISRVITRADVMDTAMTSVSSQVTDLVGQMKAITQNTDAASADKTTRAIQTLMQSASTALGEIVARLNTRIDGRYAFSGDQVSAAPIPDSGVLTTNVKAITDTIQSGTSGATVLTNLNAMTSANLGVNASLATAGDVTVRADDNINIDYTVKGDSGFFKDILRGVAAVSQMPFDPNHPDQFWAAFNGVATMLDTAGRSLDTKTGQFGQTRQQLTDLQSQNTDLQSTLQTNLSNIEDVDPAKALTQLNNTQTQLQATYQLIAQMKDLSLVNYLT